MSDWRSKVDDIQKRHAWNVVGMATFSAQIERTNPPKKERECVPLARGPR